MKVLYIFPHPDDESFGPAHAMASQLKQGHQVYLLTLTKGGATKQRHKFNYSVEQMGEVRYREMLDVEKTIGLTGMTVLDLPDSGLKEMDPRDIESVIKSEIEKIKPDVIVTYAVHGISGFHDHLVSHAVVKSVFSEMKREKGYPKRLALFTITEDEAKKQTHFKLNFSKDEEIDCLADTNDEDRVKAIKALECYKTYADTIKNSNITQHISRYVAFEFFQENFEPKVNDIFAKL